MILSVISQKRESQNGYFKKTKHAKFSEKTNISYPLKRICTCAYQEVRTLFFGKFGGICFLETPVLSFAFLPYYRRFLIFRKKIFPKNFPELSRVLKLNSIISVHLFTKVLSIHVLKICSVSKWNRKTSIFS